MLKIWEIYTFGQEKEGNNTKIALKVLFLSYFSNCFPYSFSVFQQKQTLIHSFIPTFSINPSQTTRFLVPTSYFLTFASFPLFFCFS